MKPGLKLYKGHAVGRDPREMTPEELRERATSPSHRCKPCKRAAWIAAPDRRMRWRSARWSSAWLGHSVWRPILGAGRQASRGGIRHG